MTDSDRELWCAVLALLVADSRRPCTPGPACLRHDAIDAAGGAELIAIAELLDLEVVLERVRALPPCCGGRVVDAFRPIENLVELSSRSTENLSLEQGRTEMQDTNELLTPKAVAAALHVTPRTALRSPLPWVRLSARCFRLRADDLAQYIADHRREAA